MSVSLAGGGRVYYMVRSIAVMLAQTARKISVVVSDTYVSVACIFKLAEERVSVAAPEQVGAGSY